jgi:hypothetical protein
MGAERATAIEVESEKAIARQSFGEMGECLTKGARVLCRKSGVRKPGSFGFM